MPGTSGQVTQFEGLASPHVNNLRPKMSQRFGVLGDKFALNLHLDSREWHIRIAGLTLHPLRRLFVTAFYIMNYIP
jgi:hypothetical protein